METDWHCRITGQWATMSSLQSFTTSGNGQAKSAFTNTWVQRNNGRWFNLRQDVSVVPALMPFPSIDSIRQSAVDQQIIAKGLQAGMMETPIPKESIYYWVIKEGSGREISVTDTVTAFYKGYLFW
jgi:hypothetical protein